MWPREAGCSIRLSLSAKHLSGQGCLVAVRVYVLASGLVAWRVQNDSMEVKRSRI